MNASAQPLTVAASGSNPTYQWYSNTIKSYDDATVMDGAIQSSYTPLSTQTETTYYFCIVTGSCGVDSSNIASVRVDTTTAITSQPLDSQTICLNAGVQSLSVTASGAGLNYQWYSNTIKSYDDAMQIEGATASSYTPLSAQTGTTYYYCIVNGSCGSDSSNIVSVKIDPTTAIVSQPIDSQNVCLNASAQPLTVAASGSNPTYQWYSNTIKSYNDAIQIEGATTSSYLPPTTQAGTIYYYCLVRGNCGIVSSNIVSVKVDSITAIVSQPLDSQTVCLNAAAQPLSITASGAGLTYQWYSNTIKSYDDATVVDGEIQPSYTPLSTQTGTTYYFCTVTGSCGVTLTNYGSVTVEATTISAQPIDSQTVCLNTEAQPLFVTATGPNLTYQWYSNTTEGYAGATQIQGETQSSYLPATVLPGTAYYYCIVIGSCGADSSNIVSVTVNTTTITAQPIASQTVCLNAAVQPLTVIASGAGLTYQWYSNTTGSYNGTIIAGANLSSYIPPTTQTRTTYYYCIVTGNCGTTNSDIVSVTVNTITTIIAQSITSQTICLNAAAQPLVITATGPNLTYQWYRNTTESYNGTIIAGADLSSYIPPTTQAGTTYYYCTVTGSCNTESSNLSDVAVLSAPTFTWLNLNNNALCSGSDNLNFNVVSPADSIQYLWATVPTGNSNVTIKDSNDANTVISFDEPGTYTVSVTAVNQIGGCGNKDLQTVNVTSEAGIDERKIILKQPGNLLVYPDNSMDAGKGYQWGYDTVIRNGPDYAFGSPAEIEGQVYQFFVPDTRFLNNQNNLDTSNYKYWVLLQKGSCYTKVYYNGPYASQVIQAPPLQDNTVQLNVTPNPNNGIFEMVLKGNIYGTIDAKIYNGTGALLFEKQFTKTTAEMHETIKLTNLSNGLYYLKINSSDMKKAVSRFIIQQ